jgi:hypothetical protein
MGVDDDVDPLLTSRHIGPLARKRAEEEKRERVEEEKDTRRSPRKGRSSQQQTGSHKGKEVASSSGNGEASMHIYPSHQGAPPTLVSSTGTKLRIKPPAPPANDAGPSGSSNTHNGTTSGSSSRSSLPSNSHPHYDHSSESPLSTVPSPIDNGGNYSTPTDGNYSPISATTQTQSPPHNSSQTATSETSAPPSASTSSQALSQPSAPSPYYRHTSMSPNTSFHPNSSRSSPNHSPMSTPSNTSQTASGSSGQPVQRHAKPKRLKAHTVTSKSFSIPMVPRDKSGAPMLPLNVGIMTVIHLGKVCMREHFHTERYIFPVGYEVTRSVVVQ